MNTMANTTSWLKGVSTPAAGLIGHARTLAPLTPLPQGLDAAYQLAGQTMAVNMMDDAAQEGARAFAEKRKPGWKN